VHLRLKLSGISKILIKRKFIEIGCQKSVFEVLNKQYFYIFQTKNDLYFEMLMSATYLNSCSYKTTNLKQITVLT